MITEDDEQQTVTDIAVTAADRRTDRALRAAATTIGQMADAELQRKFSQLKKVRNARTPHEVLRQQAELDSLELDQAAYKLACEAHMAGNLPEAARWYRVGAINDFAEAPLKLAKVLDSLAAKYLTGPGSAAATREELDLITEAAHWYLAAVLAGDIEAADPLDNLIARLDRQARAALVVAADDEDPGAGTCALGGLRNVMELQSAEAAVHCGSCRPCRAELIELRPLMAVLSDQPSTETVGAQRLLSDCGSALHPEPAKPDQPQLAGSPQNCGKKG